MNAKTGNNQRRFQNGNERSFEDAARRRSTIGVALIFLFLVSSIRTYIVFIHLFLYIIKSFLTNMPRLGDDDHDDDEMQPLHRRRQAVAYPGGDGPSKRTLYAVVVFVCLVWILPNFFFRVRVPLRVVDLLRALVVDVNLIIFYPLHRHRTIAKKPWPAYARRARRKNKLNGSFPNPWRKNESNKAKATRPFDKKWRN